MVKRLSELAEVDMERLQLWTFAHAAADPTRMGQSAMDGYR